MASPFFKTLLSPSWVDPAKNREPEPLKIELTLPPNTTTESFYRMLTLIYENSTDLDPN
jgi:hypothetical protein